MRDSTSAVPLLEALVHKTRLPWYWATSVVAVLLSGFLLIVLLADNGYSFSIQWEGWRVLLEPAVILYILLVYPLVKKLWQRALSTCLNLVPPERREILQSSIFSYNRRREWIALTIGGLFILALMFSGPWEWVQGWSDLYTVLASVVAFSLLAWLVFDQITNLAHLSKLNRSHIVIDIFNTEALTPVATWGLGISLAFIGGISLSVAFQHWENLRSGQSIIIYTILVAVTIVLFFVSMWSTHGAILRVKKQELNVMKKNLENARNNLKAAITASKESGMEEVYAGVAAWSLLVNQAQEAREWPYNAAIIRRLSLTVASPVIVYLLKILLGTRLL